MPTIRVLAHGETPTPSFVRRQSPIWPEFAERMTWFSEQLWERNGDPGMVYVWVLKCENQEYEKGVRRQRFCKTYCGNVRVQPC